MPTLRESSLLGRLAHAGWGFALIRALFPPPVSRHHANSDKLPSPFFHPPEVLFEEFLSLTRRFPARAKMINLNALLGTERTLEGRDLFAVKISDNVDVDDPAEPNVLLVTNHHARELMTPEMALNYTRRLVLECTFIFFFGIINDCRLPFLDFVR
jgi:hypothetical protein